MGIAFSGELRQTQATIGLFASAAFIVGQSLRYAFRKPVSYGQSMTAASLSLVGLVAGCGALSSGLTKLAVMDSIVLANFLLGSHILAARDTPHSVLFPKLEAGIAFALALDLFVQTTRFRTSHPQQAASQLDELERRTLPSQLAAATVQTA